MSKSILRKLRMEKAKLLKVVEKKENTRKKKEFIRNRFLEEKRNEQKLKAEIRALKSKASNSILPKIRKFATDPSTKKRAKETQRKIKKGFAAFQRFADRHG